MSQYEALAAWENIEGVMEKIRYMSREEADATVCEALNKFSVAEQAAENAIREAKMATSHFRAIVESLVSKTMTGKTEAEAEKMYQTAEKAGDEATAKCDAAARVLETRDTVAVNAKRLVEAIFKAFEKRPMTDCESGGASSSGASSSY